MWPGCADLQGCLSHGWTCEQDQRPCHHTRASRRLATNHTTIRAAQLPSFGLSSRNRSFQTVSRLRYRSGDCRHVFYLAVCCLRNTWSVAMYQLICPGCPASTRQHHHVGIEVVCQCESSCPREALVTISLLLANGPTKTTCSIMTECGSYIELNLVDDRLGVLKQHHFLGADKSILWVRRQSLITRGLLIEFVGVNFCL